MPGAVWFVYTWHVKRVTRHTSYTQLMIPANQWKRTHQTFVPSVMPTTKEREHLEWQMALQETHSLKFCTPVQRSMILWEVWHGEQWKDPYLYPAAVFTWLWVGPQRESFPSLSTQSYNLYLKQQRKTDTPKQVHLLNAVIKRFRQLH